jgi:ATP-dependent Lon protease
MTTIHVSGYSKKEKLVIAQKHVLPAILTQFGFDPTDIKMDDEVISYIIDKVPDEEGVRNLKRGIETVVSWINLQRYITDTTEKLDIPCNVTIQHVKKSLCDKSIAKDNVATNKYIYSMYT